MTDQVAKELAEEAIEVVFTIFWANSFNKTALKTAIADLFKHHLAFAKALKEEVS